MNILKTLFFAILLSLVLVPQAQASGVSCTGFYGEQINADSCARITVDKKVQVPGSKDFVDGLSVLDGKYHVNDTVVFKIVVQNSGSHKLEDITVVDTLPQFVTFVSGPGNFDKDSNKLTFNISSLTSGESQTFYVTTKVVTDVAFNNNGVVCVTNYVRATEKKGKSAEDNAQFCVERILKVYPPVIVKTTPPTGPEAAALPILISMAGAGMYLRKKSK